jgi:hypothetical protein
MSNKQNALLVAATAAALFLSGSVMAADSMGTKQEASVHCSGINSCKGTSECKTASNACKGQNSCKGMGWVTSASSEDCTSKGGKVIK